MSIFREGNIYKIILNFSSHYGGVPYHLLKSLCFFCLLALTTKEIFVRITGSVTRFTKGRES